jgi:hypothetical protein
VFVVEEGSRILALSLGTIQRLDETHPTVALKLLENAAAVLWSRLRDAGYLTG